MPKASKKENQFVAKNYKSVLLQVLMGKESATGQELTEIIQAEIPFLKLESAFKVKAEYVLPTLKKSQCFKEKGKDSWTLSDLFLNLENHAKSVLEKGGKPLTYEELTETIALKVSLHPSDIPLRLDHDKRFRKVVLDKVEYYFLEEWELCNEYAFSLFVLNGNEGLDSDEIAKQLTAKFKKKARSSIVMLDEDPRFRMGTDGKYSAFPKLVRKIRKVDVLKGILDKVFKTLESEDSPLFLRDIGEEFLDIPYPMTNLQELLENDLRFTVTRDRIKRSRYSLEDIRKVKREERQKKQAKKAEEAEREKALKKQQEELDEVVAESQQGSTAPEKAKSLPAFEPTAMEGELRSLGDVVQAMIKPEVDEGFEDVAGLPFVKRKSTVIRKGAVQEEEPFDLDETSVDQEELGVFLKELTDHDGAIQDLNPERFDECMRRHLPFKVTDYKATNIDVARFMVDLARPRLDHIMLDPVCGRGDFLIRVLKRLKKSLRKDHAQDAETFECFCDEQIVGVDQSEFIMQGTQLGLQLNGFDIALTECANSLGESDLLIDEMYSLVLADFSGFNTREMQQYLSMIHRVLSDDSFAILEVDAAHLEDDNEVASLIQEKFLMKFQIVFVDLDGLEKNVLYLVKSPERRENTKVFRLESLEQLSRVIDMIY
jgi:ubiquinone/menaquinone biosynthesis C-methylase UbiE